MSRNRHAMMCMVAAVILTVFVSGCGSKSFQDNTKVAQPKQIGIVDMAKAAEAHPKYVEYKRLQQEYNALQQQFKAEQQEAGRTDRTTLSAPDVPINEMSEPLSQEKDAKIQSKRNELQGPLDEWLTKTKADANNQMDAYTKEVDKVYQPQIFSIQLKIQTVQMDKEEMSAQQNQLERLQNERADKLSTKKQELEAYIDTIMSPKKAAAEAELASYAQQLQNELDQSAAAKAGEIKSRIETPTGINANADVPNFDEKQQQLSLLQKEIETMHDWIEKDIKDKAAKIAAERDLEAVLVNITVNISGVDITNDIIAAFNKEKNSAY